MAVDPRELLKHFYVAQDLPEDKRAAAEAAAPAGVGIGVVGKLGCGKSSFCQTALKAMDQSTEDVFVTPSNVSGTQQVFHYDLNDIKTLKIVDMPGMKGEVWAAIDEGDMMDVRSAAEAAGHDPESDIEKKYRLRVGVRKLFRQVSEGRVKEGSSVTWRDGLLDEMTMAAVDSLPERDPRHSVHSVILLGSVKDFGAELHVVRADKDSPYTLPVRDDFSRTPLDAYLHVMQTLYQDATAAMRAPCYTVITGLDVLEKHAVCPKGDLSEGPMMNGQERINALKDLIAENITNKDFVTFIDTSNPDSPAAQATALEAVRKAILSARRTIMSK